MRLVWTKRAVLDLVDARSFIEADNPKAAAELASRILRAVQKLRHNPNLGRHGRLRGTRELSVTRTHYLIPYRVVGNRIELLRVLHSSRLYPISD